MSRCGGGEGPARRLFHFFSPPTSEVDQYSRRHFVFFSPMLEVDQMSESVFPPPRARSGGATLDSFFFFFFFFFFLKFFYYWNL